MKHLKTAVRDFVPWVESQYCDPLQQAVPTGVTQLDDVIVGWCPGRLYGVMITQRYVARTLLQLGLTAVRHGTALASFSFASSTQAATRHMLELLSETEFEELWSGGAGLRRMIVEIGRATELPVYFNEGYDAPLARLELGCARVVEANGRCVAVADSIRGLAEETGADECMSRLQRIARRLRIPILVGMPPSEECNEAFDTVVRIDIEEVDEPGWPAEAAWRVLRNKDGPTATFSTQWNRSLRCLEIRHEQE